MNKEVESYKHEDITNLKDMLKKSGQKYGRNIAYQIRDEKEKYKYITHKEVREIVDAFGTSLIEMGLKNKKIAVIGSNSYEWEIAYLAIVCGTGIVVPLDKSLPENELINLIERSGIDAIIFSKKHEEIIKKAKCNIKISMNKTKYEEGIYSQSQLIKEGKQYLQNGNRKFIDAKINPNEMSVMLFTSGTTSQSKIVALSHKNICTNLMAIASVLDVNENDTFLSFLPLHHVFECTVGFLFALYKGAKTVFCDGIRYIPENMEEYKVSVMASVPAIYERIFKMLSDKTCKNIKLLISGAASLNSEVEQKYRDRGINLIQGYGLTETSPVVAIGTNKYYKVGSIGKTLPNVEVKLIDKNSEGIGELLVKGPNIMIGYYQNEEANQKVFKDGWFCTGDLAKIDEEGYIFICGRKKSVIVLKNGKNIFPEEIEGLVNHIEGVEESIVYGKQMSQDSADIKIFVKIVYDKKQFEGKTYEEIQKNLQLKIKQLNQQMPKYKAIKGIEITDVPLIKTTTGKIKREQNLVCK